ncbi:hypothetical protein VTI74DRAFT_3965 [Chaetomium olivicolor]
MRRGTLNGSHWEVRKIKKSWLCTWLSIDITPKRGYIMFRDRKREKEYVYYPRPKAVGESKPLSEILEYFETRVIQGVHPHSKSELRGRHELVRFRLDGKLLWPQMTDVIWGSAYDFEFVDDDAAELFAREEAWLLRATVTCSACIEKKTLGEMPARITSGCYHQPTVCRDCLDQWLYSCMENGVVNRMKCPDCSELLEYDEVRRNTTKETFERYDNLLLRATLAEMPNFHFCLSPRCTSGQLVSRASKCPDFKCVACGFGYCLEHANEHVGERCEQYKRRRHKQDRADRASAEEVEKISKPCPNCKKPIYKYTGCNHITCLCGHEWCYVCFAPFERDARDIPRCVHRDGCAENEFGDDLLDMILEEEAMPAGFPNRERRPHHQPQERRPRPRPPVVAFVGEFVPPRLRNIRAATAPPWQPRQRPEPRPGIQLEELLEQERRLQQVQQQQQLRARPAWDRPVARGHDRFTARSVALAEASRTPEPGFAALHFA